MKRLVIVGGGFAGVWAALIASQQRARFELDVSDLAITLVSRDPWLTIRPRLYESTLQGVQVPLATVLNPDEVAFLEAAVTEIDTDARTLTIERKENREQLSYDCLVLAAGSHAARPSVPGEEHAFGVDNFAEATALARHLESLAAQHAAAEPARSSAVVVGAGFTGIEVATTLIGRLRAVVGSQASVTIVERANSLAPDMSRGARSHVEQVLATLGIAIRCGRTVTIIKDDGVELDDGEWIPAATTVWTGGLRASDLTAQIGVERDESGRLPVDAFLRVPAIPGVYAAGDVARTQVDGTHVAPMSCQYAIPMGRTAGFNAIAELCGHQPQPFSTKAYVTCVDLGGADAVFTSGFERDVRLTGYWAAVVKQTINQRLIYPPVRASQGAAN